MPRFKIQELTVTQLEPTEKGPQFLATGTIRDLVSKTKTKPFVAKTIIWQGEPIFKVQEAGSLKDRKWKRGERISIARACKLERLRLESVLADADSASDEELEAAAETLAAAAK